MWELSSVAIIIKLFFINYIIIHAIKIFLQLQKLVLNSFSQNPKLDRPQSLPPIFEFESEKFYDLKSFFHALSSANNNLADEELDRFFNWCDNQLIINKEHRNLEPSAKSPYSGLSIYVPSSQNEIGLYEFLPLYQQTNLEHTMKLLFE